MRCAVGFYTLVLCALAWPDVPSLWAQEIPNAPDVHERGPVPILTGFMSYQSNFSQGTYDMNPEFDPVVLLPIGDRVLLQAEYDMSLDIVRDTGKWGPAVVDHGFDYLQGDFFAHPNLTVVGGRFLVPFGIYRERMHPLWIRYLQAEPISFTLNATSGNGGMVRGGAHISGGADITYSAYYSAAATSAVFQSDKQIGFRTSVVLLNHLIEIGNSYNKTMGDGAHNMVGFDFTWLPRRVPVELRSETLFSKQAGNTYWVEAAFRLNRLGGNRFFKYTVLVFRQEQYWTPIGATNVSMMTGPMGSLPDTNTTRSAAGADYLLTPNLRFNTAYQGNFATAEHSHTWNVGLTYRFAVAERNARQ